MKEQPICRWCGNPIPKKSESVWFGMTGSGSLVTELSKLKPTSKAEVERLTNKQVLQVRWHRHEDGRPPYIWRASLWDGESYVSEFFCKDACAIKFAHSAARSGDVRLGRG